MKLLKTLIQIQDKEGLSHKEMATKLNLSRQQWWRIRTGVEPLGARTKLRAIELWQHQLLPIFLSENITVCNKRGK
jgi:hypothetical protein